MATPNLPPFPPQPFLGVLDPLPPPPPPFMTTNGDSVNAQNHDRDHPFPIPPPPLPPFRIPSAPAESTSHIGAPPHPPPPPAAVDGAQEQEERQDGSGGDRSDSEQGSEDEAEDESDDEDGRRYRNRWRPIDEDKSVPCEDELAYISSRQEFSALDHEYWQKQTFHDLDDPDIVAVDSGRIDWAVDAFNGTKDQPNNETLMRSPLVRVGGHDWRIKFYPKGNHTDYLSVYVENVTMQSPDFDTYEEWKDPPFPVLAGEAKMKRPRFVAAQLSVVMYNPAEPRTYEYQTDAHQFTQDSSDYGWTRFTKYPRRDFYFRNHGQRQSILRHDKLAFKAYIRVVNDPTGCLWTHSSSAFHDSVSMTGLRPWLPQPPQFSAYIPLLHFAPFRHLMYRCTASTGVVSWMQIFLWKMLSRTSSDNYGKSFRYDIQSDAIMWLQKAARSLRKETDADVIDDLIGTFDETRGAAIGGNRLKTKDKKSIQAALDSHPSLLATPAFLVLELERQEFDRGKRRWKRLTNRVDMPDAIAVRGKFYPTKYTLFAFTTHVGALTSNNFNFYVRPNGPGSGWYAYTDGRVTCVTQKQAVYKHCGTDKSPSASSSSSSSSSTVSSSSKLKGVGEGLSRAFGPRYREMHRALSEVTEEVSHVVMYVRDDVAMSAFGKPKEENWDVPGSVKGSRPPKVAGDKDGARSEGVGVDAHSVFEGHASGEASAIVEEPTATASAGDGEDALLVRKSTNSIIAARHDSPEIWLRDPEGDIMMSEADDDDEDVDETPFNDNNENVKPPGAENTTICPQQASISDQDLAQTTHDSLGRDYYTGQTLNGKYHGQGHLISQSGDEYTGSFHDGLFSGIGTMIYSATGNIYTGSWASGQHHGAGKLTEASTGNVFDGHWREGRKHGSFVLTGTVTEEDKGSCGICFEKDINTAFYDCGHVVACKACAGMVDVCPVCRKRVLGRVELFGVKVRVE